MIAVRELSSIHHSVTFEVIASEPESLVSAALHSIALKRVHESYDVAELTTSPRTAAMNVALSSAFGDGFGSTHKTFVQVWT